jgi:hypothetical protein
MDILISAFLSSRKRGDGHTQYNPRPRALVGLHQEPIPRQRIARDSGIYSGSHRSICPRFLTLGAHLQCLVSYFTALEEGNSYWSGLELDHCWLSAAIFPAGQLAAGMLLQPSNVRQLREGQMLDPRHGARAYCCGERNWRAILRGFNTRCVLYTREIRQVVS